MLVVFKRSKFLLTNFIFFFSKKLNLFFLKGLNGLFFFYMPSYFFFKRNEKEISFIFLKKFLFKSFLTFFWVNYNYSFIYYILRLRLRGLGFRIRKITNSLYYFFFNFTNLFYFHVPNNILIRSYKKRLLLLSNNFQILKLIFVNLLFLKKLGPYRLLGFRFPKHIIFLKKKVKKF